MKPAKVEVWVWVLLYGGLLGVVLGVAVARQDGELGLAIALAGGAVAAVGAWLVWVRSRMGP